MGRRKKEPSRDRRGSSNVSLEADRNASGSNKAQFSQGCIIEFTRNLPMGFRVISTADRPRRLLTQSALYPEHRFRLKDALSPAGALICSGHIHDYKTATWDDLEQVWAPSTAFVIDRDGLRHPVHSIKRTGYLVHTLAGTLARAYPGWDGINLRCRSASAAGTIEIMYAPFIWLSACELQDPGSARRPSARAYNHAADFRRSRGACRFQRSNRPA